MLVLPGSAASRTQVVPVVVVDSPGIFGTVEVEAEGRCGVGC